MAALVPTPAQIQASGAMIALRSAAPVSTAFGPERVGRVPAMAASAACTSSTKVSTSVKASQEAGDVSAGQVARSGGYVRDRAHIPSFAVRHPHHSSQSSIQASIGTHVPSANRN